AELVNDDGTVKHGEEIARFAEAHGLRQVSVADIIAWRQRSEALVERVSDTGIVTRAGAARAVTYRTPFDPMQHLAVVFGEVGEGGHMLVRLRREEVVDDVFGVRGEIDALMTRMAAAGRGVIVYLREGSVGVAPDGGGRPRDAIGGDGAVSDEHRREEW